MYFKLRGLLEVSNHCIRIPPIRGKNNPQHIHRSTWRSMKRLSESMMRGLLKMGAVICIGLGFIGAFLPVLPTTPFLILATVLSYNSSPKLRKWLLEHPVFGKTIQNYLEQRSISPVALRNALLTLWGCLLLSIWLVDSLWVAIALVVTGGAVSVYLLKLKRSE